MISAGGSRHASFPCADSARSSRAIDQSISRRHSASTSAGSSLVGVGRGADLATTSSTRASMRAGSPAARLSSTARSMQPRARAEQRHELAVEPVDLGAQLGHVGAGRAGSRMHGAAPLAGARRPATQSGRACAQNSPSITPVGVERIVSAEGARGRPGMVMISPQIATTKPAPAASRTSRTGTPKPVGRAAQARVGRERVLGLGHADRQMAVARRLPGVQLLADAGVGQHLVGAVDALGDGLDLAGTAASRRDRARRTARRRSRRAPRRAWRAR